MLLGSVQKSQLSYLAIGSEEKPGGGAQLVPQNSGPFSSPAHPAISAIVLHSTGTTLIESAQSINRCSSTKPFQQFLPYGEKGALQI